ncbi:MAG TPA: hypothetical protein VK005_02085 [Acholeplasma sp.]|nr:hypothetical protein [Acholeplasma sp.]
MKKIFLVLTLFVGVLFMHMNEAYAAVHPTDAPVIGQVSTDTDFYSHWQPDIFGAKRFNDKGVIMALTSGFGARAGFRTAFDATDFEMQLDLTYLDPTVVLTTFFGGQGSYISGNGSYVSIEFLRHSTVPNKYLVAVQTTSGGAHNVSMPEFVPEGQPAWDDDAAWVGYILEAENNIVTVKILESGDNVTVTINGRDFVVASSKFYQDFNDKKAAHFLVGTINKEGTIQTVTANYVLDGARRAYYAEEGVFETFKQNLISLESALEGDLEDIDVVSGALVFYNKLDIDTLYTHDKNFFNARYQAAKATLDEAVTRIGGDLLLNDLESKVEALEARVLLITNHTTAQQAFDRLTEVNTTITNMNTEDFTEDHLERLDSLIARRDAAKDDIDQKVFDLVQTSVETLENAANDLSTIQKLNQALVAKDSVSQELMNMLAEDDKVAFEARVEVASDKINALTEGLEHWDSTIKSYIITGADSISATFVGNRQGMFFAEEKVDVRDFRMSLDIVSLSNVTGSWLTFGIMEKTELFINATDSSVQENKGLFFLIVNEGQGKARVETYLMTLYANRFFDAQRTGTFQIDITKTVEIEIGTEFITTQGVTDEYMKIVIGGHKFVTDQINVRSMRTALDDYQGYLNIAADSATSLSPSSVVIKSINGKNPTSESLAIPYEPAPFLPVDSKEYKLGSTSALAVEFYNRGAAFTVKVGDTLVDEANYTYANNSISFKSAFLNSLEAGDHEIKLETAFGSSTLNLKVNAADAPAIDDAAQGGNLGIIIAAVVGGLVLVGGAVATVLIIKKKRA